MAKTETLEKPKTYRVQLVKPRRYNYRSVIYNRGDVLEVSARHRNYLVLRTEGAWKDYVEEIPIPEAVEEEPVVEAVEDPEAVPAEPIEQEPKLAIKVSGSVEGVKVEPGSTGGKVTSGGRNSAPRSGGTQVG